MSDETQTHAPGDPRPTEGTTASGETVVRPADSGEIPSDSGNATGTIAQSPEQVSRVLDSAATPRATPSVPGFELLTELGRGAMGVVFKARQVGLNRTVALKMLLAGPYADADTRARFLIEAEAVAALEHPHVVRVFAFGEYDGFPYLAMEYLAGGSLAERIKASGPMPVREATAIVAKLARAVSHAHARGVVHRDIKPGNVLLTAEGEPRLTDFGLAKVERSDLTGTGAVLGTPAYMSPEQAAGKVHAVGPLSDVYALGAVLYDLLTGSPPFRGDSVAVTLQQVLTSEPRRLRSINTAIPRDLETVCLKCLEKDPARRYASAAELADDLDRVLAGEPVKARRAGALERTSRWAKRRWAAIGIATLVAGLLVALVIVATRPKPTPPEPNPDSVATPAPNPGSTTDELFALVEELDRTDPGWRLEQIDKARRVIPPAENSAATIDNIVVAIPQTFDDQFARFAAADDALPPSAPLPKELRQTGGEWLKPGLGATRLVGQPYGRFPIDWNRSVISTVLPHVPKPRRVTSLLRWTAVSVASDGNADLALRLCRSCLNAGRSLHDEPTAFSQLVRVACGTIGIQTATRVLALGTPAEKDLIALAELLREEDAAPLFEITVRAERALAHRVFTVVSAGDAIELPVDVTPEEKEAIERIPKGPAARTAHVWSLRHYGRLVAIAKKPTHEQAAEITAWGQAIRLTGPAGAQEVMFAAEKVGAVCRRYTALVRSASVALAIERYRLANGRWPEKLTDLVPAFLPTVPTDPEDGAPLRYRVLPDGVLVYGIGTNRQDDGGSITPPKPGEPADDVGFRLWNAELRGKGKQ